MANVSINPDDVCGVCGTVRDMHGDAHHQFTLENQLIPLPKVPPNGIPNRTQPPGKDPLPSTMLRLVERLITKGLLDGADLTYIFGGVEDGSTNRGSVSSQAKGDNSPQTPQ